VTGRLALTWEQEGEGHWVGRADGLRNPVEVEYDAAFGTEAPWFLLGDVRPDRGQHWGPYKTLAAAKAAATRYAELQKAGQRA
jgi:hypothetical protein